VLKRFIDRHFWNSGIFSYAVILRCRLKSSTQFFFYIVTSIVCTIVTSTAYSLVSCHPSFFSCPPQGANGLMSSDVGEESIFDTPRNPVQSRRMTPPSASSRPGYPRSADAVGESTSVSFAASRLPSTPRLPAERVSNDDRGSVSEPGFSRANAE
jgi:hypothetical protein